MRELLGIDPGTRTLVAGSTHPGEHEIVLAAYEELAKTFPDLVLILVPRHVEKTPLILSLMNERGMEAPFLRSAADRGEKRDGRNVVIVDRTGELFQVFSLATVVFMGGSLVPRGGQNILEPAAWGKVVLFGPSMEDFRDAARRTRANRLRHRGARDRRPGAAGLRVAQSPGKESPTWSKGPGRASETPGKRSEECPIARRIAHRPHPDRVPQRRFSPEVKALDKALQVSNHHLP